MGRTPACSSKSRGDYAPDLPVPGQKYTFGIVQAAKLAEIFKRLPNATAAPFASTSAPT